jgi:hypothetical protein
MLVTACDWPLRGEDAAAWVARRLAAEHPYLEAPAGPTSAARALVDGGSVSVLINGLDAMRDPARVSLLRELSRSAPFRVVLSSRAEAPARIRSSGVLHAAAAVELTAFTPQQAADRLVALVPASAPPAWQNLIRWLRGGGTGIPVRTALDIPGQSGFGSPPGPGDAHRAGTPPGRHRPRRSARRCCSRCCWSRTPSPPDPYPDTPPDPSQGRSTS